MNRLQTVPEFQQWQHSKAAENDPQRPLVTVCGGTGCRVYGSEKVWEAFKAELARQGMDATLAYDVKVTGCHGFCERGPLVVIRPQGIFYSHVRVEDVPEIVSETLQAGRVIERLLYVDPLTGQKITHEDEVPFYKHQKRLILEKNGNLDPARIDEYIAAGGYSALVKALTTLTPEEVIAAVRSAGLRGRGGAGFTTGVKWALCRANVLKTGAGYIVCNADEGDPGAYMDRSVMEGNPHSVIEGMLIGAYAMGIHQGFVYIRAEYPLAVKNLRQAIHQAEDLGLLGRNILGSGFDFNLSVRLGAGAFVCGEETALMASIEGRIGEPRPRPPYPAEEGLWGKPTNINNVKTWAAVPIILRQGADWYASIGTEKSKGTLIFSVVGKINNTGLVEVPMGITLRELIFDIGGGIPRGKAFKAAQIGGPSGGCLPAEHLNVRMDYESLTSLGAIVGSGGLVVADEDTCMVDFARYFMTFTQQESCGKCVPCRIGTKAMLETLTKICNGQGEPADLDYLAELAAHIQRSSLCALGQTAPNPVLSTLRYFRDEYEAHIYEKRCPAKVCKALITYSIDPQRCTGCMVCLRNCSGSAIQGEKQKPHSIDPARCTRCGVCLNLCKFGAVSVA
ncbi:NAD(P)-dependent iron-only hydrogenase diaphorase component flavoprotein [Longilinea arvoryzae]|uniref:NAD(P)-dependent iron-only hydrogenase diaphorase component flavoprotein n=1 Tax=Longilinea arvoryzae TaxID=360412 RepID=A0A0S7BGR5_9CHLR|nr:NADH-quinone oxidoreductase subunit NuoF [Longilinea arvoryzae]GAP13702.1 NAD(P)-dependent iron-only hydrogenase diaphorase component flavoprotein [Longilinea arvoryzae]